MSFRVIYLGGGDLASKSCWNANTIDWNSKVYHWKISEKLHLSVHNKLYK